MEPLSYSFDKQANSRIGWGLIIVCLIIAFMLAGIPLPGWIEMWRPSWPALLVFYFAVNFPDKFGVVFGFFTGIFLDVFNGGIIGEQALCLSMIAMIGSTYSKRFRIYPKLQQSFFVFLLFLLYVILIGKIQNFNAPIFAGFSPFGGVLASAVLWTWVALFLDEIARRFSSH